jgi:hypothetical protein
MGKGMEKAKGVFGNADDGEGGPLPDEEEIYRRSIRTNGIEFARAGGGESV